MAFADARRPRLVLELGGKGHSENAAKARILSASLVTIAYDPASLVKARGSWMRGVAPISSPLDCGVLRSIQAKWVPW